MDMYARILFLPYKYVNHHAIISKYVRTDILLSVF